MYTNEPESNSVRKYIIDRNEPIPLNALHRAEFMSAIHLKVFRNELKADAATNLQKDFEDDIRSGIFHLMEIDWNEVCRICALLSSEHAAATGCRTFDTLHLACAKALNIQQFVTNDHRQIRLAKRLDFAVIQP